MTKNDIISAIEGLSSRTGVAPATITGRAVGNSRLYSRLKNGGGCTVDVAERLLDFIDAATREASVAMGDTIALSGLSSPAAPAAPTQEHSHEPTPKA